MSDTVSKPASFFTVTVNSTFVPSGWAGMVAEKELPDPDIGTLVPLYFRVASVTFWRPDTVAVTVTSEMEVGASGVKTTLSMVEGPLYISSFTHPVRARTAAAAKKNIFFIMRFFKGWN